MVSDGDPYGECQCLRIERSDLSILGKSKGGFDEVEKSKGKNRKVPWAPKAAPAPTAGRRRCLKAVFQAPKAPLCWVWDV